jgi:DHA1 family multidrug resistance protein-like MFS transporter
MLASSTRRRCAETLARAVSTSGRPWYAAYGSNAGSGSTRRVEDDDVHVEKDGKRRSSANTDDAMSTSGTSSSGDAALSSGTSSSMTSMLREHGAVASVCLTSAVLMTSHSCASPVLPMLAQDFGASATEIGAVMSAFAAGRLVFNLPCGWFADKYGRRPLMIMGPAVTTTGMIWSYLSGGLGELVAARTVAGVGSSMYMSGATAMLADLSTTKTRARILGANQAAVLAGAAAGPALGGAIAGADGMSIRSPFLAVASLTSFASMYSFAKVVETMPSSTQKKEFSPSKHWYCDGHPIEDPKVCLELDESGKPVVHRDGQTYELLDRAPTTPMTASATGASTDVSTDQDAAMGRLVKSKDFWAVCGLNSALFFSGAGGRGTLLPILAYQSFGFTPESLGALFSAMAVTSLLGLGPAAAITDTFGRKAVIAPCVVASAASVAFMGTTTDPMAFTAASVMWAAAGSLMGTAPAAYAADISPKSIRGSALAIYRTCGDVGLLLGPLALGALADHSGIPAALAFNAALLTVSGGIFHVTAREIRRRAKTEAAKKLA